MSVTIYCDHCGQPCRAPLRPEWYHFALRLPNRTLTGHLCDECADEIVTWLEHAAGRPAVEQP